MRDSTVHAFKAVNRGLLDSSETDAVTPAVTNPTLSETVALLIESWDDLFPEERTLLTALLWPHSSDVPNEPKALGWCNRNIFSSITLSGQLKFMAASSGRDTTPGVNGTDFKGIEAAKQKLAAKV
jgi:hypothetical protein